ncbi:exodeoxyribonuclease VII small subunit [Polluticaenibacter yanchengensis]|uniref:Exodeoxyribonuclease VII small subunit n=1 Tax=Polluticaenibacter yanchengensis TaxID=3014562 RepID=A0ABT4UK26_9BACT|nr:exodeoxyribonuclease VII small subunit [Chitinophagaceae bacterium LY-5]
MAKFNFEKAYKDLEAIVTQVENDNVPLDELAEKVKKAKLLISMCEQKLREIDNELNDNKPNNQTDND